MDKAFEIAQNIVDVTCPFEVVESLAVEINKCLVALKKDMFCETIAYAHGKQVYARMLENLPGATRKNLHYQFPENVEAEEAMNETNKISYLYK